VSYNTIAPLIVRYARETGTTTVFTAEELQGYVSTRIGWHVPLDSVSRILRLLRDRELLDYVVIDKQKSQYQFCKRFTVE
jgi:hypothetical protein